MLGLITEFLVEWHDLQIKTIDSIDGILILDDLIGFIDPDQFREFGLPYLKNLFNRKVSVKFLHNDAQWQSSSEFLPEAGINLFNMAFDASLNELKTLTKYQITMLGNIPPRDVLANGTAGEIKTAVEKLTGSLTDRSRVILSCGGGMPPGVTTEQVEAFMEGANY